MARDYQVAGEVMVTVRGPAGSAIASTQQLGLASDSISLAFEFKKHEIQVDAWGKEIPPEIQTRLAAVTINMTLVHFDRAIMDECWRLSMGGAAGLGGSTVGTVARAGSRLANNANLFAATNNLITVGLSAPIQPTRTWKFPTCYMTAPPVSYPIGTEKTLVTTAFRAFPYPPGGDPWQGGAGATNVVLWVMGEDVSNLT